MLLSRRFVRHRRVRTPRRNELVFAVTEGVTYQATPKEIRDKFAPVAEVIGKADGPARADRAGAGLQRRARRPRQAGIRRRLRASGACLDGRDQGGTLQGGRLDHRLHRVHGVDADAQGRAAQDDGRPEGPHAGDARSRLDHRRDGPRDVPRRKDHRDRGARSAARYRSASSPRATRTPCRSTSRTASRSVGATAANGVVKAGPTRAARCSPFASGADQAVHRVDQDAGRRAAEDPRRARSACATPRAARDALDAVGYNGFVAPNPEVESSHPSPGWGFS